MIVATILSAAVEFSPQEVLFLWRWSLLLPSKLTVAWDWSPLPRVEVTVFMTLLAFAAEKS